MFGGIPARSRTLSRATTLGLTTRTGLSHDLGLPIRAIKDLSKPIK